MAHSIIKSSIRILAAIVLIGFPTFPLLTPVLLENTPTAAATHASAGPVEVHVRAGQASDTVEDSRGDSYSALRERTASALMPHHSIIELADRESAMTSSFLWKGNGIRASFEPSKLRLHFNESDESVVTLKVAHDREVIPESLHKSGQTVSAFLGSDPQRWIQGAKLVPDVIYRQVGPGIDLVFSGTDVGLKYELRVAPGSDLDSVAMEFDGATYVGITSDGSLLVRAVAGGFKDAAPSAVDDRGNAVPCHYEMHGAWKVGVSCPSWNQSTGLVVDPLIYGSFIGGSGQDIVRDIAVDSSGNVYVAGETQSNDFPLTGSANDSSYNGGVDVFVAKFNRTGFLLYATYYGGTGADRPHRLVLDGDSNIIVGGDTRSSDLPITNPAFDGVFNGSADGFLFRINGSDGTLDFSTYLGGSNDDNVIGVGIGASGTIVAVGVTLSSDFPTTAGSFDPSFGGASDVYAAWFAPNGTELLQSTFVGGSNTDNPRGMTLDAAGNLFVTGNTASSDFPVSSGAFASSLQSAVDAFLFKLSSNGSTLEYATFLGGGRNTDIGMAVAVDASGEAVVVGQTDSPDFPVTPQAFDTSYNGGGLDSFVSRLSADGSTLAFSSFLGGSTARDQPAGVVVDRNGAAYVVGTTASSDFPTTIAAFDGNFNGPGGGLGDAFVSKIGTNGSSLEYSTFLGSSQVDFAYGLALVDVDMLFVAGYTGASDFPVTIGAFDTVFSGFNDGWVAQLDIRVFEVSLETDPPGFPVRVDGVVLPTPGVVRCAARTSLNLTVGDPAPGLDRRLVFSNWSNGMPRTHNLVCDGSAVIVAHFEFDFIVQFETNPAGLQLEADGLILDTPSSLWWRNGSILDVSVIEPQYAGSDTRFWFSDWSDGGAKIHSLIVSGPINLTARFIAEFRVAFTTQPSDAHVTVDNVSVSSGTETWWLFGSIHVLEASSPLTVGNLTQYVFSEWSDGGAQIHEVVAIDSVSFVAIFDVKHLVTVQTNPLGLDVSVDGRVYSQSATFWWSEGSTHLVGTQALHTHSDARFLFSHWNEGGATEHSVLVARPLVLTALFSTDWRAEIASEPVPVRIIVDGVPHVTPATFWWADGTTHNVSAPLIVTESLEIRRSWIGWGDGSQPARTLVVSGRIDLTARYSTDFFVSLSGDHGSGNCHIVDCWYSNGSIATIQIEPIVPGTEGIRYRFEQWLGVSAGNQTNISFTVDRPFALVALWVTQYELTVQSPMGEIQGIGWYDENDVARLSLRESVVQKDGATYRFEAWAGDASGTEPNLSVTVSAPMRVVVLWTPIDEDGPALPPFLPVLIMVLAAIPVIAMILRHRKPRGN